MNEQNKSLEEMFGKTPVTAIMTRTVFTIQRDEAFSKIAEMFVMKRIRHLPVVDKEGRIAGIISKRDLFRTAAPRRPISDDNEYSPDKVIDVGGFFYDKAVLDSYILENVMTKNVLTLYAHNTIADALRFIVSKHIGSLVIVDENDHPIGIITRQDLLEYFYGFIKSNLE